MVSKGTGAQRVQRRRDKLRTAGLRLVQIWLPDTRATGFVEECARQAWLVRDAVDAGDEAWSAVPDETGWTT